MSKSRRCQATWISVNGLLWLVLIVNHYSAEACAADPLTDSASKSTASSIHVSARVLRIPASLEQDFLNTLPLSPIHIPGLDPEDDQLSGSKPKSGQGEERGFPFQRAILSPEQVVQTVRWTEKHKTLSMAVLPPVKIMNGEQREIELLKGRTVEIPIPQNEIGQVSLRKKSEGVRVRLSSSREADQTILKCEWDSEEFVSLNESKFADHSGRKRMVPEAIKTARFHLEATFPDDHTLAVCGFTRNSGTRQAEAIVVLIEVTPVAER